MSPLSIFSFKIKLARPLVSIGLIALGLWLGDKILYKINYPAFDEWYHLSDVIRPNSLFFVGSSHIEFAINKKIVRKAIGSQPGVFSMPGASMIARYHAIKNRLEQPGLLPPKLIVLETTQYALNRKRFSEKSALIVGAYQPLGIMPEYFSKYRPAVEDRLWRDLFSSYLLNERAETFSSPYLLLRRGLVTLRNETLYDLFQKKFGRPDPTPPMPLSDPETKVAQWEALYQRQALQEEIDSEMLSHFYQILELTQNKGLNLVLFEPPFFQFKKGRGPTDENFEAVRNVFRKAAKKPGVWYISVPYPNSQPEYFEDPAHISPEYGQVLCTENFLKAIKEKGLM